MKRNKTPFPKQSLTSLEAVFSIHSKFELSETLHSGLSIKFRLICTLKAEFGRHTCSVIQRRIKFVCELKYKLKAVKVSMMNRIVVFTDETGLTLLGRVETKISHNSKTLMSKKELRKRRKQKATTEVEYKYLRFRWVKVREKENVGIFLHCTEGRTD